MSEIKDKVIIIGAGVAGLVAAIELEIAGKEVMIIESEDRVGGRVKTDQVDGFLLDRGFQVMLDQYPEAQQYLNYQDLNLKKLDPGAYVFVEGKKLLLADPSRQFNRFFPFLFSSVASLGDKLKMWMLANELKKISLDAIASEKSISTLEYLKNYGFSHQVIDQFFKPFFRGIFLENDLNTSHRMFKFVFKMFSLGNATLPAKGIEEIPRQLASQLTSTQFCFNTRVKAINMEKIILENGEELTADSIIVATRPDDLLHQLKGQIRNFRVVSNFYFTLPEALINEPMIGLIPEEKYLSNNIVFLDQVSSAYSDGKRALLSVSAIGDHFGAEDEIASECAEILGVNKSAFKHLKTYVVKNALPNVDDVNFNMQRTATQISENVFLAGDYLLNGSLNAAMYSGRIAAQAVINKRKPIGQK
ncbi:MAG: FAD-dependent oxidoreductase [Cyclobacteriaceae bacterium]|nr:FAD-dependent oxidoreductase [Cyclobacteriaceae bacterium]